MCGCVLLNSKYCVILSEFTWGRPFLPWLTQFNAQFCCSFSLDWYMKQHKVQFVLVFGEKKNRKNFLGLFGN